MHRVFVACLSVVLVSGFNPLPVAPVHRAPQVQSQTAPNGVVRPGSRSASGLAFLPPMPRSDSSLSALPPAQEAMTWEEPMVAQEEAWEAESRWQPAAEDRLAAEQEVRVPAEQVDRVSWVPFAAGVFGFFSAAFLTLRSRMFLPSTAVMPQHVAVELPETLLAMPLATGDPEPVYSASPELRSLQGRCAAAFQSFHNAQARSAFHQSHTALRASAAETADSIIQNKEPHKLPPLPFADDGLEPHFSAETIIFHYGKHHATYVNNLNDMVSGTELEKMSLEEIIKSSDGGLFNQAAQIWNHTFYWMSMKPGGGGEPTGKIKEMIEENWEGGFAQFREEFTAACTGHFGCGWVWLIQDGDKLRIVQTQDAGCPVKEGLKALLTCDLWEHAYYIDNRNSRPKYMKAFWNVVDWDRVNQRLASAAPFEAAFQSFHDKKAKSVIMETGRRQVVTAGVAAAVAAPLLRGTPAEAKMDKSGRAPVITIFDHRGCQRGGPNKEYTGAKANSQDDEMCVKVQSSKIEASESRAAAQLAESISLKAKGIDGPFTGKA